LIVTEQEPVGPVIQLVALLEVDGKDPRLVEKETVIPGALFESCAVIVEVVAESAGIGDGLADSVRSTTVTVKVVECKREPLEP
jgi:hypothetical protein